MSELALQIILIAVLLTAVATDLRSYRIPNWLTFSAMTGGLLIHTLLNGESGLLLSLEGLCLGFGLFLFFYILGIMGAGDVKLMAAVGSFVGPEGALYAGLVTMLLGGLYAAVVMVTHWGLRDSVDRIKTMLMTATLPGKAAMPAASSAQLQLRYALVIGLGTLLSQMLVVG